jgi:hypothetical protein
MNEDTQKEFISWLGDKLQAQDQADLQKKLQTLGDDGIRKAYDQFTSEKSDVQDNQDDAEDNGIQSSKEGGRLQYIKCLQAFAKGGAIEMEKCGCGGKMEKGGALVNRGKLSIKKDMGSRKDSKVDDKTTAKKQYIGHTNSLDEVNDKPKTRSSKGGTKENEKKQMKKGGSMDQGDTIGGMDSKKKGGKMDVITGFKKGGKAKEEMKTSGRMEYMKGGTVKKETGGTLTQILVTYARGGSINEGKITQKYPSGIKDPNKETPKLKSKRKDSHTKEANPGKKEYLDPGKAKKEHIAVTKVPLGNKPSKQSEYKAIPYKMNYDKKASVNSWQAGGSMAGTVGGMMAGAGVRNPSTPKLVKKKVKILKASQIA